MVLVVVMAEASVATGLVEGLGHRLHIFQLVASYRNGSVGAVPVVSGEVLVRLHLAEVGQNLRERPLVVAPRGPIVIVLGDTPKDGLSVYGARPARRSASGDDETRLRLSSPPRIAPCVCTVVSGVVEVVAVLQVLGQMLEVGIVRARLQQQHRLVGVFREPVGQHTPCRASPDDNVVVFHRASLLITVTIAATSP